MRKHPWKLLGLTFVFCPDFAFGENTLVQRTPEGHRLLLPYPERVKRRGRTWHITFLN